MILWNRKSSLRLLSATSHQVKTCWLMNSRTDEAAVTVTVITTFLVTSPQNFYEIKYQ